MTTPRAENDNATSFAPRAELPKPTHRWSYVVWAEEGMEAWLPWNRERGSAIKVTVACAAGNSARVVNHHPRIRLDRWVKLEDLCVPEDDPHAHVWGARHE